MRSGSKHTRQERGVRSSWATLLTSIVLLNSFPTAEATHHMKRAPPQYLNQREHTRPLTISNQCSETIWPAIGTQAGTGPSVQGFALASNTWKALTVSADWQGRVWGRTNCSFNAAGTGPSVNGGLNGGGESCVTGDCAGVVDCRTPVSNK